eukprot:588087-Pyramimonas_sp.AAC.1
MTARASGPHLPRAARGGTASPGCAWRAGGCPTVGGRATHSRARRANSNAVRRGPPSQQATTAAAGCGAAPWPGALLRPCRCS